MSTKKDRFYGSLMGGFVGDALGGRYEFMTDHLSQIHRDIARCNGDLDILGKGVWNLYPGQITDDSELALTLAQNILNNTKPDQESLAKMYIEWYRSDPFDIGSTTKNAFSTTNRADMINASKLWNEKSLADHGTNSLSNGALMRIAPMCIFCAGYLCKYERLSIIQISNCRSFLKIDTQLTHYSNEALNYCYFFLLLCVSGIIYGKLDHGFTWIDHIKEYLDDADEPYRILHRATDPDAVLVHDPKVQQGDMRIAYQLAIRKAILCQVDKMTFEEALVSTIKLGGDTDTNACIVGILCGAVTGAKNIPGSWIDRIINAKPARYDKYALCKHLSNPLDLATSLFKAGRNCSTW